MPLQDEQIRSLIANNKLLDEQKLAALVKEAADQKVPLADLLIEKDIITDENLGILIADSLQHPFIVLSKISIPLDILQIVPEVVAKSQEVIAFAKDAAGLKVATANPSNVEMLQLIAKKTGDKILVYFATERDIKNALKLYHKELQKSFDEMVQEQIREAKTTAKSELSVSKIVDLLIEHAYHNKVSDIHIEPNEASSLVRFRIDGMLHDVLSIPHNLHEQIVTRIKVLSRLRTDEHLSAQDGKIHTKIDKEDLDLRISILPVVDGEKIVMRLLSSHSRQFSLQDLGFSDKDFQKVHAGFMKPHGMVLSTGPTGSGKSTTIYAMIKLINAREINIATIEDPVEYDIEGINQIQVNAKTNLTFADGLRAILRQDPDVIFVGEIRDRETASIAINAALTGHLVFSTLHTNDAATTLPRLIDMNVEPFLVASTVNVIIGQRLVRKICERCRYSFTQDQAELSKVLPAELVQKRYDQKKQIRMYKGKGCAVCHNTGYQGRIGIFEVLEVSESIRKLITDKVPADLLNKQAIAEGMTSMMEDGLNKVDQGLTTVEEILRATTA